MRYKVTEQGPIDQHPPGADVTDVYPADVLERLMDDGYVEAVEPKRKAKKKAVSNGD